MNNPITSQNITQSVSSSHNASLPISNDLSLEIQSDNLKLQSQLTLCKSQLLANKKEIKKLSERIVSLEQDKIDKEKEYNTAVQELQDKSNIEMESIHFILKDLFVNLDNFILLLNKSFI